MHRYALLLPLLAGAACAAPPRPGKDLASPFAVVTAEYSVPIALGTALPGKVGGWNEGVSLKKWVQGWTHQRTAQDSDQLFVNFVLHPLSGSDTHLLARTRGWSFTEAFLF